MRQTIDATHMDQGSSVFVSKEVNEVLTKQDVFEVYRQHASGEGDDQEMQRAIRTSDMAQYLQIRSLHETDSGVRVVVVTEFILGTTTIDLDSPDASGAGFTRG